jgi:HTH-type transcriptional regulator/antitoxin HipB
MTAVRWPIQNSTHLGTLVRARRAEAGLTLTEAAGLLGVGRRLLIELEQGRRHASLQTVLKVLHGLGLELVVETRRVGSGSPATAGTASSR